jgi:CRP-like cAMP-binding protein
MKDTTIHDQDLEVMTFLHQRRETLEVTNILKNTDFFSGISEENVKKIVNIGATRKYKKGEVLFEENSKGEELFIVVKGSIAVRKNVAGGRKRNLGILNSGEILGEISLFDSEPRSAEAEAIEDSEVIVIPNVKFHALLKENCELAVQVQKNVIAVLCQRLRKTDDMLKEGVIWGFKMES